MGMSYIFMVPLISSVVFLAYIIQNKLLGKEILFVVLSSIQSIYLLKLLQYGSRGPILSIALCAIFFIIVKYSPEKKSVSINNSKVTIYIVIGMIVFSQLKPILLFINDFLAERNIKAQIIEKTLRLLESNDALNGRDGIYEIAIRMFWESPFIGHGISTFDHYTGINYPHNLVIQLLFDGGLLLTIIFLCTVLFSLNKWRKNCDSNMFYLLIFLFFVSIPGAFASGDIWENERLWVYVGFSFSLLLNNYYIEVENEKGDLI